MATSMTMPIKPRVFISHVHEDNDLCMPLLAALDAWGIDYWFDQDRLRAGDLITQEVSDAIRQRDVFLRICSGSMQSRPRWVSFETAVFQASLDGNNQTGILGKRILINLIVDTRFRLDQTARVYKFIDTIGQQQQIWIAELRHALQLVISSESDSRLETGVLDRSSVSRITREMTPEELDELLRSARINNNPTRRIVRPTSPRLLITHSEEAKTIQLLKGQITIRRPADENTIWIHDSAVSRLQATITCSDDGECTLCDGDGTNASANATWVNGTKLGTGSKHVLQPGDEIQVGETKMRFENS